MSNFGSIPNVLGKNAVRAKEWRFDAAGGTLQVVSSEEGAILYAVNITDGITIYSPTNPATTASRVADKYVELVFDTSSMSDNDELLIMCDAPEHKEEFGQLILNELRLHTAIVK